jgi:DNA-binding response OmpR family regulator
MEGKRVSNDTTAGDDLPQALGPVLLVLGKMGDHHLSELAPALRTHSLLPLFAPTEEAALRMLNQMPIKVAFFTADLNQLFQLVQQCKEWSTPTIVAGTQEQLTSIRDRTKPDIHLPLPADSLSIIATIVAASELAPEEQVIKVGTMVLDPASRQVTLGDRELLLPPKELEILFLLALSDGRPVPTDELLQSVWGGESGITPQDVHWHVWKLKKILGEHGDKVSVANRRGFGYTLCEQPPQ